MLLRGGNDKAIRRIPVMQGEFTGKCCNFLGQREHLDVILGFKLREPIPGRLA